ncbi:MAG: hypothetical protein AAFP87_03130 [Pseudomonadota bacterium]
MDSVSVAFELMRLELDAEVENLNSEGASFFQSSEYEKAKSLGERGVALRNFFERVEEMSQEWSDKFASDFPEEVQAKVVRDAKKVILSASKGSKTILLVRFPNGDVISQSTAASTLEKTISLLGYDTVANLGIKVNGENIVSRKRSERYNDLPSGGFFIKTHSSTKQKKKNLDEISERLGLGLSVSIVNP